MKTRDLSRRNPSASALRFYAVATLIMLVLFCTWRSWGIGILLGITALTLLGHALNVIRSRRLPSRVGPAQQAIGNAAVSSSVNSAVYGSGNKLWKLPSAAALPVLVAGLDTEPSSVLIVSASWFRENAPRFQHQIATFLSTEAVRFAKWNDAVEEIKSLKIESIQLPWEDRPADGMVYFTGNKTERVWRCEMIDRRPENLGFDD